MATTYRDIAAALDSALSTYATANSVSVAWENKQFEPVTDTPYIRPTLLPGNTEQAGLGANGLDEHLGLYQIDIFAPIGDGKKAAIDLADAVADVFSRGSTHSYNGVSVRIVSVSRGTGAREGGAWFVMPVLISYRVFTQPR